jgi:hypothetical protein
MPTDTPLSIAADSLLNYARLVAAIPATVGHSLTAAEVDALRTLAAHVATYHAPVEWSLTHVQLLGDSIKLWMQGVGKQYGQVRTLIHTDEDTIYFWVNGQPWANSLLATDERQHVVGGYIYLTEQGDFIRTADTPAFVVDGSDTPEMYQARVKLQTAKLSEAKRLIQIIADGVAVDEFLASKMLPTTITAETLQEIRHELTKEVIPF